MKYYPVVEQFDSIQGEGAMIGMPVTFIRLFGCNLTCPWCDSKETWTNLDKLKQLEENQSNECDGKKLNFTWMSAEELAEKCEQAYVVITGGEPTLHDLTELIDALHEWNKVVCIETNGTNPTHPGLDWVVASPKPPQYFLHPECRYNELKYVVDDAFNVSAIPECMYESQGCVWLQPCDYKPLKPGKSVVKELEAEELTRQSYQKCFDLTMKYPYLRVGIQLHKVYEVR